MTKKRETQDVGEPVSDDEAANLPDAEVEYSDELGELEPEPGEFPVYGHEPLYWPRGLKVSDILDRLDALESAVFGKGKK